MTRPRSGKSRPRAVKPQTAPVELLEFDDDARVRLMAGAGDRHFLLIEEEIGVRLSAPGGGQIQIAGADPKTRLEAKRVLNRLYSRLEKQMTCDEADIRSVLHHDDAEARDADSTVIRVPRGTSFMARTARQADYIRALNDPSGCDLIFGVGPAGTGKTLLAVAYGAAQLALKSVDRLIITRPAVEAGEKLGFLPGDLAEKVDPYLLPVWDALSDALGRAQMEKLREDKRIEVAPLAFMRGRTLNRAIVIVDEAQNATRAQMRMVLTRLGEGSRMIVTGDPTQTDLDQRQPSGLPEALDILEGDKAVKIIRFERRDVVRHNLVGRIVDAYERRDAEEKARNG